MEQNITNPNPSSPSITPIRLDILDKKGEVLVTGEYVKEKIVLGRILSADLRVDDLSVSRIHALIEVRGTVVSITDLASSHGTFINGKKVVESKLSFGDTIRLGTTQIRISKGSGVASVAQGAFEGQPFSEGDATQTQIDRALLESLDRRAPSERRKTDAFPEETRMDTRRDGDRRLEQRVTDRRAQSKKPQTEEERRSGDRRTPLDYERRLGSRRRTERRVFDITSLERRIEDRRTRTSDGDLLPEELEKAFEAPSHTKELEVTALWGDHILDVSNYYNPVILNVGEGPQNDYIIPSEGIPDEFPLITVEEDGTAYLAFTGDMTGTIRARDKIYSIEDLKEEKFVKQYSGYFVVALKQDDFAKISIGTINFFLLYVRPAPRIKRAPFMESDPLLIRMAMGSLLLLALLFVSVAFVPKPTPVTIEMIPERFAKIVIKKRPKIDPVIIAKNEKTQEGGSKLGEGGKAAGPEGEVGHVDKPKKAEKPQVVAPPAPAPKKPVLQPVAKAPTPKVAPPMPRKVVDQNKAKSVGLLKAFSQSGIQKELKNLIDSKNTGQSGFEDFGKAVVGLQGKSIEAAGGAGGQGLKGVDAGGGGKTVGIDGPSTKGLGRGYEGDGIGEGISGPGRLGMKGEHSISIASENVQVLSGLPKDVINAVVQRHRGEIRNCYDAALQRNPALRGKIVIAFNIAANGIVTTASVKESSLSDSGLHNCITSRVKTWIFPKPEAPVMTEVSAYPFYLNPAN
jgi:outer membrane biosynthesis protein TonB